MQLPANHLQRLDRERKQHDEIAAGLDPALLPTQEPGPLELAIFAAARVQPGMRVLDLGCGSGGMSLQLLARGARVTGVDLSPGMVDVAQRRAALHFPTAEATFLAAPVEDMGLDLESFDAVVGRFILHHLDLELSVPNIARLLAPGGRASFAENSAKNPLLMFARRNVAGRFRVVRLGTPDERPITDDDIGILARHFTTVAASYPVFDFFQIFDRQVLRFRRPTVSRVCRGLDAFVERRVSWAQPYSFRVVVTATR